ncbi:unnamed protein product [Mortierella alpina]
MAQGSSALQQGLLGTVLSPSLGTASALVSIQVHEGMEYISVASIRALYPTMVRLEVDGHTVTPTLGFRSKDRDPANESQPSLPEVVLDAEAHSSESSCQRRDSAEATSLGEFVHALINVDESLGLEKSTTQQEDLQESPAQVDSNDPIVAATLTLAAERGAESDIISPKHDETIGAITPCPADDIEWIEYHPGKIIHVVHDLAALSCEFSPDAERQHILMEPFKVAVPGSTGHSQEPLLPNAAPAQAPSPISNSLDDLPESYWLRFRQEMEEVVLKFLLSKDPSAEPEEHHREAFEEAMALSIHRQVERVTRRPAMPSPLSKSISRDPSTSPSSEDGSHEDGAARSMSPDSEDSSNSDRTLSESTSESHSSDSSSSGSSSPEHSISDDSTSRSASPENDGSSGSAWGSSISTGTRQASRSPKRARSPPPLRDSHRPREDRKRHRVDHDDTSDHAFTTTNRQRKRDSVATNELFVFSGSGLARFVEDQKGTIHNLKTQAITVSLSSWPIAQQFCKFLCSKQYHGIWLDVSFTWNWGPVDMDEFVRAVESTNIQVLFLNRNVSQQHWSATSHHCDSLVRLLSHKTLKELHLTDMPDILRHSKGPLPTDLSHLRVLELSYRLADRDGQQNGRFLELVKAATHLRHLILDAPPEDFLGIMKQIRRAIEAARPRRAPLVEYQPSAKKPPSSVDVQFSHGGKSRLTLQIERAIVEIRECSLNFGGSVCRSYPFTSRSRAEDSIRAIWTHFLRSDLSHSLTTLRIRNQVDDSWISPLLEWCKAHRRSKKALLQEIEVDCQRIPKSRFSDFCELLDEVGSTVTRLRLANMRSLVKADWILFFKSLNYTVLRTLHVEGANLGDREVRELIGCLKDVSRRDKSVKLTTLTLLKTIVSAAGWKELQNECNKHGWRFSLVSS